MLRCYRRWLHRSCGHYVLDCRHRVFLHGHCDETPVASDLRWAVTSFLFVALLISFAELLSFPGGLLFRQVIPSTKCRTLRAAALSTLHWARALRLWTPGKGLPLASRASAAALHPAQRTSALWTPEGESTCYPSNRSNHFLRLLPASRLETFCGSQPVLREALVSGVKVFRFFWKSGRSSRYRSGKGLRVQLSGFFAGFCTREKSVAWSHQEPLILQRICTNSYLSLLIVANLHLI